MSPETSAEPLSATQQILRGHNPNNLPTLRFNDGDVVIKLGESPNEWLLVHKSIIQAGMPLLAPTFKADWAKPDIVEHPTTGEQVEVHTVAIKYADQTYVLEGKEVVLKDFEFGSMWPKPFAASELSVGGWPEVYRSNHDEDVIHIFTLLFTVLYGFPLTLEAVAPGLEEDKPYPIHLGPAVDVVIKTCAYAEYYGCLSLVAPVLLDKLLSHPDIWHSVAYEPAQYFALAKKLRCDKLYFDAFRHLIAETNGGYEYGVFHPSFWKLSNALEIEQEEAKAHFLPGLESLEATVKDLQKTLLKFQLSETSYHYSRADVPVLTSFLNMLSFQKKKRSDRAKCDERSQFLARSIFTEWLIQQLHGQIMFVNKNGDKRSKLPGGFAWSLQKLELAANSEDPTTLFGHNVASHYASVFGLGKLHDPEKQIKEALKGLVVEACKAVDGTFRCRTSSQYREPPEGKPTETVTTYRRTERVRKGGYFTYLGLDEADVQWKNEPAWEAPAKMPEVNLTPASEEVFKVLTIVQQASEVVQGTAVKDASQDVQEEGGKDEQAEAKGADV
ncbi:hypothetical protein LTR37_001622 [Vermiconidia calcicola]|uniref:Uncharacterized protein n=1 Tax=Vermiconidia calcicola TaxID=1690605 RepID=A0ACC3NY32_9PEZI|nr:hypothetical protein LTR37_001622 [Vermiconidia calcicola]